MHNPDGDGLVAFANYGGADDDGHTNTGTLRAHPDGYTYSFLATGDRTELSYDDQCYDTHGALAGFAVVSPVGAEYWVAVYMSFDPIDILVGEPWNDRDLNGVVELWYEWLDQMQVTVTPRY